jgi:hypothetical protein
MAMASSSQLDALSALPDTELALNLLMKTARKGFKKRQWR